ncbi:T9SS type A sorting domain-containing protein [Dyadobacter bucti]|uniref:T9SS type A sorting domain-containing protein n=1 Tax=Dyadobacter bucti TaxID=2572203 RepID=UPI001108928C|nr:T9SS type A sorting domain-containing protein [Dyadobacter bucti]
MERNYTVILLFTFFCTIKLYGQPGSLDQTFGQGGKVVTDVDQIYNQVCSVLIQNDGKIVAVGYSTSQQGQSYMTIIRYMANGSLDGSFGVNGISKIQIYEIAFDQAFCGVIQPDGKIVIAGCAHNGYDYDFAMVRLTKYGARDLTFGSGGIVTTDFNASDEKANQIVILPNGKLILAGYTIDTSGFPDHNLAFARYESNGNIDTSFGANGSVSINLGDLGFWQSVRGMALQPDGRILATGFTEIYDFEEDVYKNVFFVSRLNEDGGLDSSFGANGTTIADVGAESTAHAITIQSNGRILISGKTKAVFGGYEDFALVRFNSDGSFDNTFGSKGIVLVSFDTTSDIAMSLVVQPDNKILALGYTAVQAGTTLDFALVRFNSDGQHDVTFGNNGRVITDIAGNWDFGTAVALQKDGKIVVGGYSRNGSDYNFALVRYNNDAALPVELISFDVKSFENHVRLDWQTGSEINSYGFEIQRSSDGKRWEQIESVKAAEYTINSVEYHFLDLTPRDGKNLYRLKMVDQDRTYSYSTIRSVHFAGLTSHEEVKIYPNPANDKFTIELKNPSLFKSAQLLDQMGRQVFYSGKIFESIDLHNFSNGSYLLIVELRNGWRHPVRVVIGN